MAPSGHRSVKLGGRNLEFRQVASKSARKLRLRVGPRGVEVVKPLGRSDDDVISFLDQNEAWIL